MKQIITTFTILLLFSITVLAQKIPNGMKYQAVARDAQGQVLSNQDISLKITLNNDAAEGKIAYSEVHYVTTNVLGLIDLTIGSGNVLEGSLETVPWSSSEIWMNIAIDEQGGDNFITISSSKLLAVPYAMHSGSAGKVVDENGEEKSSFYWKIFGNTGANDMYSFLGTLDNNDLIFKTNGIERLRISASGEVSIEGDLSVGNNALIGNDLMVTNNASIGNDLDVDGEGTFGNLTVKNTVNLNTVGSTTTVGGPATLQSTLGVDGATDLNSSLNVDGTSTLNNALTVNSTSALNGKTTITAAITGGMDSDISQYPLLVKGGDHGIAIKANGDIGSILSPGGLHRSTNFLTCFDGQNDPLGRIEGFHEGLDLQTIARSIFDAALPRFSFDPLSPPSYSVGDAASSVTTDIENIISSFNSDFGIGIVSGTLDLVSSIIQAILSIPGCTVVIGCDDLAAAAVDVVATGIQLGIHFAYFGINPGVAFESGGADYAEWLEKADPQELLMYGDVVGVKGGLISKEFMDAEKFMIISANPTIIGAMPDPDNESAYSKIAFMGQVPVKVIGEVKKGDYILPSGNGDGLAIAVNPDAMKAKDYNRIIGIAWGESEGKEYYNYVNTAVGINSNDLANMVEQMQMVMNQMQIALQQVNPDYQPSLYDVDSNIQIASTYTTGPTLEEYKTQTYQMQNFAEIKLAFNDMVAQNTANGLDMSRFPFIGEIFENPEDEQLRQTALEYYTQAQARLQEMVNQLRKH